MPVVREISPCEAAIHHIVMNLRDCDRAEIMALRWDDDLEGLSAEVAGFAGPMWRIWTVDDEPASIMGITPIRPGVVMGGAFGTPLWRFTAPRMLRWGWRWAIPRLRAAGVHRGESYALACNTENRAFIEAAGGEVEALLEGYGRNGEDFLLYRWRFQDVSQCSSTTGPRATGLLQDGNDPGRRTDGGVGRRDLRRSRSPAKCH